MHHNANNDRSDTQMSGTRVQLAETFDSLFHAHRWSSRCANNTCLLACAAAVGHKLPLLVAPARELGPSSGMQAAAGLEVLC
jgi:hypothetical protein